MKSLHFRKWISAWAAVMALTGWTPLMADRLILKNGEEIDCIIQGQDMDSIFYLKDARKSSAAKNQIQRIKYGETRDEKEKREANAKKVRAMQQQLEAIRKQGGTVDRLEQLLTEFEQEAKKEEVRIARAQKERQELIEAMAADVARMEAEDQKLRKEEEELKRKKKELAERREEAKRQAEIKEKEAREKEAREKEAREKRERERKEKEKEIAALDSRKNTSPPPPWKKGLTNAFSSVWRSALIPGWSQYHVDRRYQGTAFFASTLALGAITLSERNARTEALSAFNQSAARGFLIPHSSENAPLALINYNQTEAHAADVRAHAQQANLTMILLMSAYFYNLADAYRSGTPMITRSGTVEENTECTVQFSAKTVPVQGQLETSGGLSYRFVF